MGEPQELDDLVIEREPHRHRLVARVGGVPAGELTYHEADGHLTLVHTEVAGELEGRGIAGALAAAALEWARSEHWRVVPLCPFVTAYLRRHPDQLDLVDEPDRSRLSTG